MNAPQMTPAAQAAFAVAQPAADTDFDRLMRRELNPIDLLDAGKMDTMMQLAEQLAHSKLSVPEHLRGNVGDCLAIVTQAMLWNMNPFAVAQKTHLVSGRLGYEAQLVIAVVMNSGAIRGSFHFDYRGEGNALECRVGAVLRGQSEVTWGEWLNTAHVTTKNSPLWKTNPRQQLGYLQAKNWSRLYVPGAILGVYSIDELADSAADFSGDATPSPAPAPRAAVAPAPAGLPAWPAESFATRLPKWQAAVNGGTSTADILAFARGKGTLTAEQEAAITALVPVAPAQAPSPAPAADPFVADMEAAERGEGGGK
jgi:hypothetical protein